MKIMCYPEKLYQILSKVLPGVSSRSTLPILAGVHLQFFGYLLQAHCTNLDIHLTSQYRLTEDECMQSKTGVASVDAKALYTIIHTILKAAKKSTSPKSLEKTGDIAPVTLLKNENTLSIMHETDSWSLPLLPDGEFPFIAQTETISEEDCFTFDCVMFHRVITTHAWAAADDASRPVLTNLCIHRYYDETIDASKISFATANSIHMAYSTHTVLKSSKQEGPLYGKKTSMDNVLVPVASLKVLQKLMPHTGMVSCIVNTNRSQMSFSFGGTTLTSRLTEGTYVDAKAALPQKYDLKLVIGVDDLLAGYEKIKRMAKDNMNISRLITRRADEGGMIILLFALHENDDKTILSERADLTHKVRSFEGIDVTTRFDSAAMIQFLVGCKTVGIEQVALYLNNAEPVTKPSFMKPYPEMFDYTYVIMPLSIDRDKWERVGPIEEQELTRYLKQNGIEYVLRPRYTRKAVLV